MYVCVRVLSGTKPTDRILSHRGARQHLVVGASNQKHRTSDLFHANTGAVALLFVIQQPLCQDALSERPGSTGRLGNLGAVAPTHAPPPLYVGKRSAVEAPRRTVGRIRNEHGHAVDGGNGTDPTVNTAKEHRPFCATRETHG